MNQTIRFPFGEIKARELSFTMAMVFVVCKCANEMEAFRYRFLDGLHIGQFADKLQNFLMSAALQLTVWLHKKK